MAKQSLVIVESPAKAKTIGKYLGKDYEVKACMGHLRDLQKSKLSVDVDNDFEPVYKPIKGKEAIISDLKKSAKAADTVYLATDPDREGEAISWHLKSLLDLPDKKTKRVTFNEITKNVVRQSIENPRDIDQNLVDAQQARRILDRLVGYQLSPLLWKKIKRGLSAGRVQSVATRMVDDREREIENFKPEEYWTLDAVLTGNDVKKQPFSARYHGKNGKKAELKSAAEVEAVVEETKNAAFAARCEKLNAKHFDYLEYKSANGTDFRCSLMESSLWCGGGEYCENGIYFNPNMPTEEIFTTPKKGCCEGRLVAAMPLSLRGTLVEDFYIDFKDGKAVNWHAEKGGEALTKLIETDEGSRMLGELALVPKDSPIAKSGLLFYNTLFDENASCHVALGSGYTSCVKDYTEMREEGVNDSMVHVDFMVGAQDLCITGYKDGKATPVFINGSWAPEFE